MSSPKFQLHSCSTTTSVVKFLIAVGLVVASLAFPHLGMAQANCKLSAPGSPIQHVVYIQFDNLHLTRDNPNIPSDLEQIPHKPA